MPVRCVACAEAVAASRCTHWCRWNRWRRRRCALYSTNNNWTGRIAPPGYHSEHTSSGFCRIFAYRKLPMTYCVSLNLSEGLAFVSVSRTFAGVDHIVTIRMLPVFGVPGERLVVLQ